MKTWRSRIILLLFLAAIVGLPLSLRRGEAGPAARTADPQSRLIIISPHNEFIRAEFAAGFNRYRAAQGKSAVEFDWRSSGGTSDLMKQMLSEFEAAARDGRDGIDKDLFFGGGDLEHNRLARGLLLETDGKKMTVPMTTPARLPPGLRQEVFPSPDIGGLPLHHPDLQWVGAALASFGIVYNRDVLRRIPAPEPVTWDDLARSEFQGLTALADPAHAGSVAATYNVVLRRMGWTEGWPTLRRVFANARYFTASASKVPVDVSAGEAAAGMCIDFYGRSQAGAVGGDRVGYVDPQFMTAITADPICILHGAPHAELANEFVVWLLSKDAQRIWQQKVGTPGGPERYELRRMPIRRDMYVPAETATWTDPEIRPFDIATPLPPGMPDFFPMVAPLSHAMAIDVQDDLRAAWRAINAVDPTDARRAKMVALFDAMPDELVIHWPDEELARSARAAMADINHPRHAEAAATLKAFVDGLAARYQGFKDQDRLLRDRLRWTLFFRENYRKIVRMGEE